MKTERINEEDGMVFCFEAKVLDCTACDGRYAVELDRTAFFPEGGGQAADTGTLSGACVRDVQLKDGRILHYTDLPFAQGSAVRGEVDREIRLRRMQNHSGEHVLSGTLHRMYGANNVGFHLGSRDVTVDIDVVLTRDELMRAEETANRAVADNLPIRAFKPSREEAEHIPYRSKKEIGEDLRLVMIEGVDCCACCAPHVPYTGQIGMIKILDAIHYKGGMRLHLLCGLDAEEEWERTYRDHAQAAGMMSVKQTQVTEAVSRLLEENAQLRRALREERKKAGLLMVQQVPRDARYALVRLEDADMQTLRETVLALAERGDGVFAVCCSDGETLTFAAAGSGNLSGIAAALRRDHAGRCGGNAALIQGTARIGAEELEDLISRYA